LINPITSGYVRTFNDLAAIARESAMGSGGVAISCDSAELARLLLGVAADGGADAARLARDAHIPAWVGSAGHTMVPSRLSVHLFELVEHALDDPHVALTVPVRHQVGDLDLYDYLFLTAPTLRDALHASGEFFPLISTNDRFAATIESESETTYAFRLIEAAGRGRELMLQFAVAMMCARVRAGTGQPIAPVRVGFAFPAPARHAVFAETLGTSEVDFGCPITTFTFRNRDLDLPMTGSDPRLASILSDYARLLPPSPLASWQQHFRLLLDEQLAAPGPGGGLSLDSMAHRLGISRRSLQRELASRDTSWRAELDAARQRRARLVGAGDMRQLAKELGYADPRSARRIMQRWRGRVDGGPVPMPGTGS
jgi:AraC-like DNA-binding protein